MTSDVRLSIVTSMYRSSAYLEEFYSRMVRAISAISSSYEFVFVNDGSPDDSLAVALRIRDRDPRVRIVDLSRNFGHHRALMTGLARARGELVFLIDCDLEEEPEWLLRFRETLQRTGADVVYGVQTARKGGILERAGGAAFYTLLNRMMNIALPRNVITARLMTRRYVRALVQHMDREICLAGLWVITGFDQHPLPVVKGHREDSTYSLRARVSAVVNAVTSFSNRPLIYIFYLGAFVVTISTLAAAALTIRALTTGIDVAGYASLIVSIWLLGGLTLFSQGIIGVYLAKVFTETKDRPYTIVRAEYGMPELDEHTGSPAADAAVLRR
jgi:putative glycosyltransferase